MPKVILNAAHGGSDAGGISNGRLEKNDNLKLAIAVGNILEAYGIEVVNIRDEDIFISPITRADTVNEIGGDLLISFHRGNAPISNTFSGARVFIDSYDTDDIVFEAANNILDNLEFIGYPNNGIGTRWYYLLDNSDVPGFVITVGYINSDYDNELFDERFNETANAIAQGIVETFQNLE